MAKYATHKAPHTAKVIANKRLTHADWEQEVRHIELDVSGSADLTYQAGDVAVVMPRNDPEEAETFLRLVGVDPDSVLEMSIANTQADPELVIDIPSPCTARDLAERHLDLHGVPRRSFLELLMQYSGGHEDTKERLEYLGSSEASENGDFQVYVSKEHRSYVEVMLDFPHAKPPLEALLDAIPRLQPRQFSIASSDLIRPGVIEICVAVVAFTTPYKRARSGCCSTWLSRLGVGDGVTMWVRNNGSMRAVLDPNAAMIMVGPGTGIAPLR